MIKNVIILGAGASAPAGAPLMNNFIDVAEDLLLSGSFDEYRNEAEKVFELLDNLQKIYAKSDIDLNNIESLFGIVEMAQILKRLGDIPPDEIPVYRDAVVKVIVHTIQRKMKFKHVGAKLHPPLSYVNLLNQVTGEKKETAFITFNYDVGIDTAIQRHGYNVDYGIGIPGPNAMELYKLHGSFNWAITEGTNDIVPYTPAKYIEDITYERAFNKDGEARLNIHSLFNLLEKQPQHINKRFKELPLIVPPTWNKTEYHGQISKVWASAAEALSQAQNFLVIGYSLPHSDSFFRYLFALGTLSSMRLRKFWVINTDTSGETEARFKSLLGKGAQDRFKYFSKSSDDMVPINKFFR